MYIAKRRTATLILNLLTVAGLAGLVSACGSDDDAPAAPSLQIKGTAAVGAAIANGPVSVTCKSGTGSATTNGNGEYTVDVTNGTAPCVLTVTTAGGATLRSISNGGATNITPLTELLVSYIATQSGAGANASPATLATNANVNTVMTNTTVFNATVNRVINVVKAQAGTDLVIPTDFLTASLVAKSASNPNGNALDQVLDTMRTRNVITSTGAPAATVVTATQTDAARNTITGATGGT
jgi:hypothetical protein